MLGIQHLIVIGSGSSLNAAMYGAELMNSLRAFQTVQARDATSVHLNEFQIPSGGVLAVSQSGETKEVLKMVFEAQKKSMPCFSITNGVGSKLALTTKVGAYQNAGLETAVTSTKSFSTQVTVMALMACWFAQNRDIGSENKRRALMDSLHRLPSLFKSALATKEQCKEIAKLLQHAESCFVVSNDSAAPVAAEGSLKLRELAYLHARPWYGPEDESPFSLIMNAQKQSNSEISVIMLLLGNRNPEPLQNLAAQLHNEGVKVVIITDNPQLTENICSHSIVVPENGPLTPLLGLAPLQLIAYELAVLRGYNPDVPRNLSKTVKD